MLRARAARTNCTSTLTAFDPMCAKRCLVGQAEITAQWADLRVDLAGRDYRARRIDGAEPEPDPFVLLTEDAHALGAPMHEETLAVIGAKRRDGKDGFILLAPASPQAGGRTRKICSITRVHWLQNKGTQSMRHLKAGSFIVRKYRGKS